MENLTASSFDFNSIVQEIGKDPFAAQTERFAEDKRFYKLTKDKEGNGGAVIRFLPDKNRNLIQQVNKINTTISKNGKKRFVNELSPTTIGLPCPFQEEWARLWNAGQKEESKSFGRTVRYYANIKVIKDPNNKANEGQIFLLDMSGTLKDKIQKLLNPSQTDRDLGANAYELFNPLKGNSFRLVIKNGTNGIPTYDSSDVIAVEDSIYNSVEEALEDIKNNTHDLNEFRKPESFLSYEKLQEKLRWVTFADVQSSAQVATVEAVQSTPQVAEVNSAPIAQDVPVNQPATQAQTAEQQASTQAQPTQTTQQTNQTQSLDAMLEGLI